MAHKFNFGQKFLIWTLSLIMISISIPLTAKETKAICTQPSFVTNQSFPSGTNNRGAFVGDVNNDGKLDIVTTNNVQPNNQISVMLGNGDGTFQAPLMTQTENGAEKVVLADFNNDGKLDVAISVFQAAGAIAVHLGNGNGTFGVSDIFIAGNFPNAIHSADFNNDGKKDLVVVNNNTQASESQFSILFGNGNGSFGLPNIYGNSGQSVIDALPIDINQDNSIDLEQITTGRSAKPWFNSGSGTFTGGIATTTSNGGSSAINPTGATVGDFNGDGRSEVAVGHYQASGPGGSLSGPPRVGILFRTGAANSNLPFVLNDWFKVWATPGLVNDIAAADFNGDGRSDLAYLDNESQTVSIQLDTTVITNGTNDPPVNLNQTIGDNATNYYAGINPQQVLTGDFNSDGKIDLAVRADNGNAIQILLNAGSGRFNAAFRPFVVGGSAYRFNDEKTDLNGDGLNDLVALGGSSTLNSFLGSLKGNFKNAALRPLNDDTPPPRGINFSSLGDFDGDGKKDIVGAGVGGSLGLRFWRGNGDGTFTDSGNATNAGTQYYATAVGDFNNDAKLDVVATRGTNVALFRGNGQGVFFSPINFTAGTDLRFIVSADFNNDGKPDVATTDFAAGRVVVLLGNGAAGFGTQTNFAVGTNPSKITLADFNQDGKPDIAVSNEGSNNVSVLLGNGAGGFGATTNFAIGAKPVWVSSGDLNNDGKLDLLTANLDANSVSILFGNGDGTFNAPSNITYNISQPTAVTAQDANFDGRPDLITATCCFTNGATLYSMSVLLNSCDANPTAPRTRFDFDGDGRSDISVYRPSSGIWYFLNSQSGFSATQFGISSDRLAPADYDGDGRTDIAVYRDGIWYLLRSTLGFTAFQFGIAEDIPQPADFDGDGRAEVVVFRPSNGIWYVFNLVNNNFSGFQFGSLEDKPVVGDYDGDNRADYAVFRPSNGVWYYQQSTNGFGAIQFGLNTDRPVPADYDGDGRTDVAVYRPSSGIWYYQRSTAGFGAIQFGLDTDKPSPADYDGDGRADVAVFRPSNGVWYLQRSTLGFSGTQFGIAEDKPIPNAFVP